MAYQSKNCIGCPDAKNGCQMTRLKVQPAKKQEKRSMVEVVQEACEIFGKYEITKGELARAEELCDKLKNQKITVSVIGQFKRGKSTLVNAILEDKILPVGIVPVTAVVTTIEYGEKAATVRFDNGIVKEIGFDEMSSYINEQENSDNHLGVSEVELYCPSPFLQKGLTFAGRRFGTSEKFRCGLFLCQGERCCHFHAFGG